MCFRISGMDILFSGSLAHVVRPTLRVGWCGNTGYGGQSWEPLISLMFHLVTAYLSRFLFIAKFSNRQSGILNSEAVFKGHPWILLWVSNQCQHATNEVRHLRLGDPSAQVWKLMLVLVNTQQYTRNKEIVLPLVLSWSIPVPILPRTESARINEIPWTQKMTQLPPLCW